ncbi:MAG: hypothetical protein EOO17_04740 [Chloroflexi bacterium]|nr:MAG: hypothetical protein EOO17_04740 [Chloroflexota bacterium]
MKVVIVCRQQSETAREVSEYLREFHRRTGQQLPTIDPDTREGADLCRLYDIVEYPTVVATDDNGIMLNMWRGTPLPTMNEVSYYVQ